MPDLTDRDRERFEDLHEKLEGVSRAEPEPEALEAGPGPIDPMLASTFEGDLAELSTAEWIAEQKYDGTRLILQKFDSEVRMFTRRHVERSDTLPDLVATAEDVLPDELVLDGEYTFLDPDGVSRFLPIHAGDDVLESEGLTGQFAVFDVLARDGMWCTRESLMERKERLADLVPETEEFWPVDYRQREFESFYEDQVEGGEEGIMVKRRESAYHPGTRSVHWRKVKHVTETDLLAVGITPGEGARSETFGALVLTDGERYVGRVGSGFTEAELEAIREAVEPVDERPVPESTVGMAYTPIEPFVVQVKYQEVTPDGELRAPVFLRRRPDKPVADVQPLPT